MEQVHGTHKASKFEPQDFISAMPDKVITNILDRLPIKDAVKTDVLSKYWKFKWTLLTRLVFDEDFFRYVPDKFEWTIISRLLLHLNGPITKFVWHIPYIGDNDISDLEDIKHFIIFLSRKGIKEIIIDCENGSQPYLLTQVYYCMELKHLELSLCSIFSLSGFHGFPNLLSLHLNNVYIEDYLFGEFIAQCPLLEILSNADDDNKCQPRLIEISKLGNLKKLSWTVCIGASEPTNMIKSSCFYQLTALPKLQELNLDFGCWEFMAEAGVDKVPAAFLCLKTLTLSELDISCDIIASFVLKMICNSPNLQTLNIREADAYGNGISLSTICSLDLGCKSCNTMKQLQLQSVSISSFRGSENELCLIKFILISSPLLKKIVIEVDQYFLKSNADIAWRMAGKLLNIRRASPILDIDLHEVD